MDAQKIDAQQKKVTESVSLVRAILGTSGAVRQKSIARKCRYINVARSRTWPRFRDQIPRTNALSPPDGTYCLPRVPVLPPTSTCATSYEYLWYLLRVPAAYLGLLNFAARSKKYLSSYR
jgi:hypothetical protein